MELYSREIDETYLRMFTGRGKMFENSLIAIQHTKKYNIKIGNHFKKKITQQWLKNNNKNRRTITTIKTKIVEKNTIPAPNSKTKSKLTQIQIKDRDEEIKYRNRRIYDNESIFDYIPIYRRPGTNVEICRTQISNTILRQNNPISLQTNYKKLKNSTSRQQNRSTNNNSYRIQRNIEGHAYDWGNSR